MNRLADHHMGDPIIMTSAIRKGVLALQKQEWISKAKIGMVA